MVGQRAEGGGQGAEGSREEATESEALERVRGREPPCSVNGRKSGLWFKLAFLQELGDSEQLCFLGSRPSPLPPRKSPVCTIATKGVRPTSFIPPAFLFSSLKHLPSLGYRSMCDLKNVTLFIAMRSFSPFHCFPFRSDAFYS